MKRFLLLCGLLCSLPLTCVSAEEGESLSMEAIVPTEEIKAPLLEAADLLIGNFYQTEIQSIDISYLSPFGTEKITVVERGIMPSNSMPATYWLLEIENISEQYVKPMAVLNHLGVRQTTQEEFSFYTEMEALFIASPESYVMPVIDESTHAMAPGDIWQIRISSRLPDPYSEYALVDQLLDPNILVASHQAASEELVMMKLITDPNFDYQQADQYLKALTEEIEDWQAQIDQQALALFDDELTERVEVEKAALNISLSQELTVIEHGVQIENSQTLAYWIIEVQYHDNKPRYISSALWEFEGNQEMPGLATYPVPLTLEVVTKTPDGNYMPLVQPTAQAIAPANWHGFIKLSFSIAQPMYRYSISYQNQQLEVIGDWGKSIFE